MMNKEIKDVSASRRGRLLNMARKNNLDFDRLLLLYLQEKFLSRLSKSPYRRNFFLKGGILLYGEFQTKTRSTRDLDFLAVKVRNDPARLEKIIAEIISIPGEDGVTFRNESIAIKQITGLEKYGGLRIKVDAHLGTAKKSLQIDIGFGDVITPSPKVFHYPALLEEDVIEISAYSWESVIAEKFEAIVSLSVFNSRLKDFYDIRFLQQNKNFEGEILSRAVTETFKNRGTDINDSHRIFSNDFKLDQRRNTQWRAFLGKSQLTDTADFPAVLEQMENFIMPVVNVIADRQKLYLTWDYSRQKWV